MSEDLLVRRRWHVCRRHLPNTALSQVSLCKNECRLTAWVPARMSSLRYPYLQAQPASHSISEPHNPRPSPVNKTTNPPAIKQARKRTGASACEQASEQTSQPASKPTSNNTIEQAGQGAARTQASRRASEQPHELTSKSASDNKTCKDRRHRPRKRHVSGEVRDTIIQGTSSHAVLQSRLSRNSQSQSTKCFWQCTSGGAFAAKHSDSSR